MSIDLRQVIKSIKAETLRNRFLSYFIVLAGLLAVSCTENKILPKDGDTNSDNSAPDISARNIETIFVDSSYTKAILKGVRASIYNNPPVTTLGGGISVEFLSKETGARLSILTADSAYVDDKSKNMTAIGNVVVVSDSSHSRLETSVLNWDNARQKVFSKEFVRITSPAETVTGIGFESDIYLHNYVIYKINGERR